MTIKIKSVQPKEFSVSMTLDRISAETLVRFMVKAVDKVDISEILDEIYSELCDENIELDMVHLEDAVTGIISGLKEELA